MSTRVPDSKRIPTIQDLRVKQCFICLETEELSPAQAALFARLRRRFVTPNEDERWIHPCHCSLVVHDRCLRHWAITRAKWPDRCPQCNAKYEYESRSLVHNLFNAVDGLISRFSTALLLGSGGVVFIGCMTTYHLFLGLLTFRAFAGSDIFHIFVDTGATGWSLVDTLFRLVGMAYSAGPLVNLVMSLGSPTPPLAVRRKLIEATHLKPLAGRRHPRQRSFHDRTHQKNWPLSRLTTACLVLPGLSFIYRQFREAISMKLLGVAHLSDKKGGDLHRTLRRNVWDVGLGNLVRRGWEEPHPNDGRNLWVEASRFAGMYGQDLVEKVGYHLAVMGISQVLCLIGEHWEPMKSFLGTGPSVDELGLPGTRFRGMFGTPSEYDTKYWERYSEWIWDESDPVWWRYSISCLIFRVLADSFEILVAWVAKREVASRKPKNQTFDGIDPSSLDLIIPRT